MKFKCLSCGFETEDGQKMTDHHKSTTHRYKIIRDVLDLSDENVEKVAKVYAEQALFAYKVAVKVWEDMGGDKEAKEHIYSAIFPAILDKVLTPALYIKPEEEKA